MARSGYWQHFTDSRFTRSALLSQANGRESKTPTPTTVVDCLAGLLPNRP
jgi:hypothetical protein